MTTSPGALRQRGARVAFTASGRRIPVESPVPRRPTAPLPRSCTDLVADAGRTLGRAIRESEPSERYSAAHLAALRGAAAILAARAHPRRSGRRSAWELLAAVAPELAEWARYFAAGASRRQAIDAGLHTGVTAREADDMVRQAAAFLDLVDEALFAGSLAS